MPSPKITILEKIEFQILKNLGYTPSDEQKVELAQSLLNAIIGAGDTIVDTDMPSTLFGAALDWSAGGANDATVNISSGTFSVEQDLESTNDPIGNSADTTPPGDVTGLNATNGSASTTLTWNNPSDTDFNSVKIWYGIGNTDTEFLGGKSNLGTTISGLIGNTLYTFLVKTMDNAGNLSIGVQITSTPNISDSASVAADKTDLEIGYSDPNEVNYRVINNITLPISGTNGSTITWDASGNSAIDNSGIVTRPLAGSSNISGDIIATITKGSSSDTKTFTLTVLAEGVTLTLDAEAIDDSSNDHLTIYQTKKTHTLKTYNDQIMVGCGYVANTAGDSDAGSVTILENIAGTWTEQQIFEGENTNDYFGVNGDFNDTDMVISSPYYAGSAGAAAGKLYFYEKQGSTWTQIGTFEGPHVNSAIGGTNVSLYGNFVVATFSYKDYDASDFRPGFNVYEKVTGTWTLRQEIVDDSFSTSGDFGDNLYINDHGIIVSSKKDIVAGLGEAGKIYIYKNNAGTWVQDQVISGTINDNYLGTSMSADNDYLIISDSSYTVYIYKHNGTIYELYSDFNPNSIATPSSNSFSDIRIKNDIITVSFYSSIDLEGNSYAGFIGVFRMSGKNITLDKRIGSPAGVSNVYFGYLTDIGDNYIVTSAANSAHYGEQWAFSVLTIQYTPSENLYNYTIINEIKYGEKASDRFGESVCIDGNWAIVGDEFFNGGATTGKIYFYENVAGTWTERQTFEGESSSSYFGKKVAINGNWAIIGSPGSIGGAATGKVYIYENVAGTWTERQTFEGENTSDYFGDDVAINGNWITVNATHYDGVGGNDTGKVYIYENVSGTWTERQTIEGENASDQFGFVSAIRDNWMTIGSAYYDGVGGTATGKVYIYENVSGTWTERQTIEGENASDQFGWEVAIDSNYIIIGAKSGENYVVNNTGSIYIYKNNAGTWSLLKEIGGFRTSDEFGFSLSIDNGIVVVGAPLVNYTDNSVLTSNDIGKIYIYNILNDLLIKEELSLYNNDFNQIDQHGYTVSISGNSILVGTPFDDNGASTDIGSVSFYDIPKSAITIPIEDIKVLGETNRDLDVNDNIQLQSVVLSLPNNTTSDVGNFTYASSNTGVASVDSSGLVSPVSAGTATITIETNDPKDLSDTLDVTVNNTSILTNDWTSTVKRTKLIPDLYPDDTNLSFGDAFDIIDDICVVGAPYENNNGGGAVYIFENTTGTWTRTDKLMGSDQGVSIGGYFGGAVAIKNDILVIGASGQLHVGKVYIYKRITGTWTFQQQLSFSGSTNFGWSVATNGNDYIVVTDKCNAGQYSTTGNGAIHIYKDVAGTWTLTQTIDGADLEQLGYFTDIDDGYIIASNMHGTIYSYKLNTGTGLFESVNSIASIGYRMFKMRDGIFVLNKHMFDYQLNQLYLFTNGDGNSSSMSPYTVVNKDHGATVNDYHYVDKWNNSTNEYDTTTFQFHDNGYYAFNLNLIMSKNGKYIASATTSQSNNFYVFEIDPILMTSYTIDQSNIIDLNGPTGGKIEISNISPANVTYPYAKVTSSNEAIAKIDIKNNITPIATGTININGIAYDEGAATSSNSLTVVSTTGWNNSFTGWDITGISYVGMGVAAGGNRVVIGQAANFGENHGGAIIYTEVNGELVGEDLIPVTSSELSKYHGSELAISGDNVIMGSIGGSDVIFFNYSGSWSESQTLVGVGKKVDIDGDYAIISNKDFTSAAGANAGVVHFYKNVTGTWTLLNTFEGQTASNYLGYSIGISGSWAVVSEPYSTETAGSRAGSVSIYENVADTWTFRQKIEGASSNIYLGWDVDIDGDFLVISSIYDGNGVAHVYENAAGTWTFKQTINGENPGDQFGTSVSIGGNFIAIGAANYDGVNGNDTGCFYVYENQAGTWTQVSKLEGADASLKFGTNVAINETGTIASCAGYYPLSCKAYRVLI